ncbi:MAG: hypothetical protein ABJG04_17065 [Roseobacter sp.]
MIQAAAEALNTTDARINTFLDNVDADVLAAINEAQTELGHRQSAYDILASNLFGVVGTALSQSITWNPDATEVSLTNGGTASTWGDVTNWASALPFGSEVSVELMPGKIYDFTASSFPSNIAKFRIWNSDNANRPTLRPTVTINAANKNYVNHIHIGFHRIIFSRVNIEFVAADDSLAWDQNEFLRCVDGPCHVLLTSVGLSGGAPNLIADNASTPIILTVSQCGSSGPNFLKRKSNWAIVSDHNSVFTNGALLVSGYTLGSNFLEN